MDNVIALPTQPNDGPTPEGLTHSDLVRLLLAIQPSEQSAAFGPHRAFLAEYGYRSMGGAFGKFTRYWYKTRLDAETKEELFRLLKICNEHD